MENSKIENIPEQINCNKLKNEKSIGILVDEYGNKYEGEIINNQANGHGTKSYEDGRINFLCF